MPEPLRNHIQKLQPPASTAPDKNPIEMFLYRTEQAHERVNVAFSDIKIVFVLQGCKEVYTPAQKMAFRAGEGFLLKAGNYLMTERFARGHVYESLSISFSAAAAAAIPACLLPAGSPFHHDPLFSFSSCSSIDAFIASMRSYFTLNPPFLDWKNLLQLKLQELFWLLSNTTGGKSFNDFLQSLNPPSATTLQTLMESHYNENLTLEELAFLGGLSLSTFKRKFGEIFHTTPHRWI
jgi:hypothetical protein